MRAIGLAISLCLVGTLRPALAAGVELPAQNEILKSLRAEHPRLLATRADFQRLAAQCKTNELAGRWLNHLREDADHLIAQPPVKFEIPDGKRLLAVSRTAKQRLLLLGLLYQLTGETKYAERAWVELAAVCEFQNWNPSHFLDTAEMTLAVSLGYDWCYAAWSSSQRETLQRSIVHLGLEPGLAVYRAQKSWSRATHNWNQVCNGGLAVGALAVASDEPELASEVLHGALESLPLAMKEFAPDGGWAEGPGYWHYATEYNVYVLAALNSALNTDFGLSRLPGFDRTGDFPLYFVGPTGKTFNFADAHDRWRGAPQLFWLAATFNRPDYAAAQLPYAQADAAPLDLLFGAPFTAAKPAAARPLPLAKLFHGVEVATVRSAWNDRAALFVGFKGGSNRANHGHLDLGTFVLDAQGERFALDLDPDDYNLPGYFGGNRWQYVRCNTWGHNTLLLGDENQSPAARASFNRFSTDEKWSGGVLDLSAAWPRATRVERGIALVERRRVVVQDEVQAGAALPVLWQMLTDSRLEIHGREVTLTKKSAQLVATLVSPAEARWRFAPLEIPAPQEAAPGVVKLTAQLPNPTADVRFVVVFDTPAAKLPLPAIVPLSQWPGSPAR